MARLRVHGTPSGLWQGRRNALLRLCLWAGFAAIISWQSASRPAFAEPMPDLSGHCLTPAWPEPPLAGSPPIVGEWTAAHVPDGWLRPPCVDWGLHRFSAFVAVTGSFQASGMAEVLSRIASSSAFKGMRYWSVTDGRLESLIMDAYAVQGPSVNARRSDFMAAELQAERELFFVEVDNRSSGPVLYRLVVLERRPDRLVIDIANESRIRSFLMTVFEPGDLRTTLFMSAKGDGTWTCYALASSRPTAFAGLIDNPKSHVNRLVAFFGHVTGLEEDTLPWAK